MKECIRESYESEVTFNFEKSVKLFYDSTTQFVVSLYNNNNFNRSDVLYIQTGMVENILKPITSILKTAVKKQIVEPVLLSMFDNIVGIILNPFFHCSIEYRLNNWLIENKLLSNIQQITINNEIYPVNHADQICYNEKVTKGTLLPLKIQFKQFFENGKNFQIAYDQLMSFKI